MNSIKKVFSERFWSLFEEQNYKSISAFLREYKEKYPHESFTHKVFLEYRNAEATPSMDRLHNLCNMWNVSSDYLLGLSEKKECKDIQYISKKIGLSEEEIEALGYIYEEAKLQQKLSKTLNARCNILQYTLEAIDASNKRQNELTEIMLKKFNVIEEK